MPAPSPAPHRPPTRRSALRGALAGLGVLAAAGCGVRWAPGAEVTPTAQRGPDDDAREAAVADTRDLLGLLLPAARGAAPLQAVAASAVAVCEAHLRALGEHDLEVTATVTATSAPSAAPGGAPAAGAGTSPVDPAAVLDRLVSAAGAALAGATATAAAPSGGMARLLASLGASRAVLADDVSAATGVPAGDVPLPAPAGDVDDPPAADPSRTGTAALQAALAGEHAAVFALALVQGRLSGPRRDEAAAELVAHRVARDDLVDLLVARDANPVQAEAGYDVQAPTAAAAAAVVAAVDEGLARAHADVVAADATARVPAARALLRSARAARRWGSTVTAFPGMPELGEDGTAAPSATSTAVATSTSPATP